MRHFIPLQDDKGGWHVAYGNHRGEFIAVMECGTLIAAYHESEALTLDATKRALCGSPPKAINGNRYLRNYE